MHLLNAEKVLSLPVETVPARREVRRVKGLKWAELRDYGPLPKKRKARGVKTSVKRGYAYERIVQRELKRRELGGELYSSQWIMFADENGLGWAQPDIYLLREDLVLLIEVKLTQHDDARCQLLHLYLPLLRHIYQLPVVCLQVCKNLRYVPRGLVDAPEELLRLPTRKVHTWQYIGN